MGETGYYRVIGRGYNEATNKFRRLGKREKRSSSTPQLTRPTQWRHPRKQGRILGFRLLLLATYKAKTLSTQFCLIVHECFLIVERKEQIQGLEYEDCPKAIRVPANDSGILEANAFFSTARVRHVSVDTGFHTVSRQAWRYCHSLRIVKLPDTVVAIGYAAFQGCYSLKTVEMPGCVELGVRLFSECCALERVGIITDGACHLAVGAVIGQYAFEECDRLAQLSLPHVRAMTDSVMLDTPQAGVPQGSFYASGIRQVELG